MSRELALTLAKERWITRWQLENALQAQLIYKGPLLTNLIKLGYLREDKALRFSSKIYNIPLVKDELLENIPPRIIELIPRDFANKLRLLPIGIKDGTLMIAVCTPPDSNLIGDLSFFVGMPVRALLCSEKTLVKAIKHFYLFQVEPFLKKEITKDFWAPSKSKEPSEKKIEKEIVVYAEEEAAEENGRDLGKEIGEELGEEFGEEFGEDLRENQGEETGELEAAIATIDALPGDEELASKWTEEDTEEKVEELYDLLADAETRDEIIENACVWTQKFFEATVFLTLKESKATIFYSAGHKKDKEVLSELEISLDDDSACHRATESGEAILCPCKEDVSLSRIMDFLELEDNGIGVVLPIIIKEKTIGLLACLPPGDGTDRPTNFWHRIQKIFASAFETLILSRKIGV